MQQEETTTKTNKRKHKKHKPTDSQRNSELEAQGKNKRHKDGRSHKKYDPQTVPTGTRLATATREPDE